MKPNCRRIKNRRRPAHGCDWRLPRRQQDRVAEDVERIIPGLAHRPACRSITSFSVNQAAAAGPLGADGQRQHCGPKHLGVWCLRPAGALGVKQRRRRRDGDPRVERNRARRCGISGSEELEVAPVGERDRLRLHRAVGIQ